MNGHGPRRGGVKMALHLGYEPTTRVNVDAHHLADCRQHQRRATHRDYAAGGGDPLSHYDGPKPSRLVHSSWSRSRALTQVNAVEAAAVLGCGCKAARSGSREGVRDATW